MIYTSQGHSGVFSRMDDLPLSRRERLRVNAYMHDGELIAEFICRVLAYIHSGTGRLARAIKPMLATTVKR